MRAAAVTLAMLLTACGQDEPLATAPGGSGIGFDPAAVAELQAAGVDRYFGKFEPETVEQHGEATVYTYAPRDDGPTCLFGDPFRVSVRDVGSEDLLIYLQGGGACWSKACAANKTAGFGIQPIGWTDADAERNPTLAHFNVLFVAYCDGSVFSGDNLILGPTGEIERRHRGLANLSAALDLSKKLFALPRRIVLAGSSAGGYGTILGTVVVRLSYPDVPLTVINDAGLGLTNPDDPSIVDAARDEWKFAALVPPSCQGCLESGQFTTVIRWALDHDPSLKVGAFSAYEDAIIGGVFLGMKGPDYRSLLLSETDAIHAAHPERFQRFFIDGGSHTAILAGYYDLSLDGTTLLDWTTDMVDGGPAFRDLLE